MELQISEVPKMGEQLDADLLGQVLEIKVGESQGID